MMKTQVSKNYQSWEKQRSKGRLKFILIDSALMWGGLMCVVVNLAFYFKGKNITLGLIAISWFIFLIGGGIRGVVVWAIREERYQKYMKLH